VFFIITVPVLNIKFEEHANDEGISKTPPDYVAVFSEKVVFEKVIEINPGQVSTNIAPPF
jgi:hypothetical protein